MGAFEKALEVLDQEVNKTFSEPIVLCIDGLHEDIDAVFSTPDDIERSGRGDDYRVARVEARKSIYQIEILNRDLGGLCVVPGVLVQARGRIFRITSAEPPELYTSVFNMQDTGDRLDG